MGRMLKNRLKALMDTGAGAFLLALLCTAAWALAILVTGGWPAWLAWTLRAALALDGAAVLYLFYLIYDSFVSDKEDPEEK